MILLLLQAAQAEECKRELEKRTKMSVGLYAAARDAIAALAHSPCAVIVVDQNLLAGKVNDCGLAGANATATPPLAWSFTPNTNCAGTLTLTIDRGYTYTATLAAPFPPAYTIEGTKVTLSYPYKWQFNKVIVFVAPGATYAGVSQITSFGLMQNLN